MTNPYSFRVAKIVITSEATVRKLCDELLKQSQWFSVLPMPDDAWELTVKEENQARLHGWLQSNLTITSL